MSEETLYDLIDFVDSKQIRPVAQGTAKPVDVVAHFFTASVFLVIVALFIFKMAGG